MIKWRKHWLPMKRIVIVVTIFILVYIGVVELDTSNMLLNHDLDVDLVDLTLLSSAKDRGALCLDGSLPGYHFRKGFGSGSNNWIIHVEGGGWCNTIASCIKRKSTPLGSSSHMEQQIRFQGILSGSSFQNPDFYNWNKVKFRYCDGGSFTGHSDINSKSGEEIIFRGQYIWDALVDELMSMAMGRAEKVLLSGCSAGGLATLIHCDSFKERLPKGVTFKCLADAGFFIDEKDVRGNFTLRSFYHDVAMLQELTKNLPQSCISQMDLYRCMFPREITATMQTPLFIVQPAYDFWQIQNILVPDGSGSLYNWRKCRLNLNHCNSDQLEILGGFRASLLREMRGFLVRKDAGHFINSCFVHCQTWMGSTWHSPTSPRINNKTIAESVGDWFFDRGVAKLIDCSNFRCNPTCHNLHFLAD